MCQYCNNIIKATVLKDVDGKGSGIVHVCLKEKSECEVLFFGLSNIQKYQHTRHAYKSNKHFNRDEVLCPKGTFKSREVLCQSGGIHSASHIGFQ